MRYIFLHGISSIHIEFNLILFVYFLLQILSLMLIIKILVLMLQIHQYQKDHNACHCYSIQSDVELLVLRDRIV